MNALSLQRLHMHDSNYEFSSMMGPLCVLTRAVLTTASEDSSTSTPVSHTKANFIPGCLDPKASYFGPMCYLLTATGAVSEQVRVGTRWLWVRAHAGTWPGSSKDRNLILWWVNTVGFWRIAKHRSKLFSCRLGRPGRAIHLFYRREKQGSRCSAHVLTQKLEIRLRIDSHSFFKKTIFS